MCALGFLYLDFLEKLRVELDVGHLFPYYVNVADLTVSSYCNAMLSFTDL